MTAGKPNRGQAVKLTARGRTGAGARLCSRTAA
jgi:hypothetical protein